MKENEALRASCKRWKRKFKQEVQVNKELGRRVAEWKHACEQARLDNTTVNKVDEVDLAELDDVDISDDFSSVIQSVVELSQDGVNFNWGVPCNDIRQFCYPDREPISSAREPFAFVLSGGPITPMKQEISCLDGAVYGLCVDISETSCMCVLSRRPFLKLFVELCRQLIPQSSQERIQTLEVFKIEEECDIDKLLAEWGHSYLLEQVSLDQLIFLLGCLLLEVKVVVVSKNPGNVSGFMLGLLPLLRPLQWVQPFIPLLPHALSVASESPIPVLIGACSVPDSMKPEALNANTKQEAVLLVLDTGELQLSPALAESYHTLNLPGLSQIYHRVVSNRGQFERIILEHISNLLQTCRYFGHAVKTFAEGKSSLSQESVDEKLQELLPILGRGAAPWEFLLRLQTTQMYIQWSLKK